MIDFYLYLSYIIAEHSYFKLHIMKRIVGLLILSCFLPGAVYSQDYLGNWVLDNASYNNGTLGNATGYFKFKSDSVYEAEFSDGSNYAWAEALYNMSEKTLNSTDGENLALNGMSMVSGQMGASISQTSIAVVLPLITM